MDSEFQMIPRSYFRPLSLSCKAKQKVPIYCVQSILRGSLHVFLTLAFNPAKLPNGLPHG